MAHGALAARASTSEGKRVAVIGTGCTGYQLIPELALEAEHVVVFQRTPQWLFGVPGYRSPFPPQVTWLDRNLPYYTNFMRFRTARHRPGVLATDARSTRRSTIRTPCSAAQQDDARRVRSRSSSSKLGDDPELAGDDDAAAPAVVGARRDGRHASTASSTRSSATT